MHHHLSRIAITLSLAALTLSGCGDGGRDSTVVSNPQVSASAPVDGTSQQQQTPLESAQELMQLMALGTTEANTALEDGSTLQDLISGLPQLAGDELAQTTLPGPGSTTVPGPNGGTVVVTRDVGSATLVFDKFGTRKGGLLNGTLRVARGTGASFTVTFTGLSVLAPQAQVTRKIDGTAVIVVAQSRPNLRASTTYNLEILTDAGASTNLENFVITDAVSNGTLTRSYAGDITRSGQNRNYAGTFSTTQAFIWSFTSGLPVLTQGELLITGASSQYGSLKLQVVDGKVQVSGAPAGSQQFTQVGTLDPQKSYTPATN